jgi:hypothetical protein
MGDLVILVPVLRRPHRVRPLLDSIRATTPDARVLFITDPGDHAEHAAIAAAHGELLAAGGRYSEKINAGIAATTEPLIFLGADDLEFHPGWLDAATALLTEGVGLVGTQDLCNGRVLRGEHATHFLMARWYAELGTIDGQPGPLCVEYPHEMVDDELVATARRRSAWAFANDSVVEHLHPMAGKAPMDDLYAGQHARMRAGRRIFQRRRALWEG